MIEKSIDEQTQALAIEVAKVTRSLENYILQRTLAKLAVRKRVNDRVSRLEALLETELHARFRCSLTINDLLEQINDLI